MKLFALTLASFSLLASAPVLATSSLALQLRGKPGGRFTHSRWMADILSAEERRLSGGDHEHQATSCF